MIANRRRQRQRWLAILVAGAVVIGLFIAIFCVGPTGLFSIYIKSWQARTLDREVLALKTKAAVMRSDIEEHQKPENIKRAAVEKLHMKLPTDSGQAPGSGTELPGTDTGKQ